MKKILSLFAMVGLIFAFVGCADPNEPRYTIWTGKITAAEYSDFENTYSSSSTKLQSGQYTIWKLGETTHNQLCTKSNAVKHSYTKEEIKAYLKSIDFSDEKAEDAATKLLSKERGMIAAREGDVVDLVIK